MHIDLKRPAIAYFLIVTSALACTWQSRTVPSESPQAPTETLTAVVGNSTSVLPSVTPSASATLTDEEQEAFLRMTIVPYPTPGESVTPWNELVDPSVVESIQWADFESTIVGSTAGLQLPISVLYPRDWFVYQDYGHILSVQNVSREAYPEYLERDEPLAKFEVLWIRRDPRTNAALPEVITVQIAGENSLLWEDEWLGEKIIGALVQKAGTHYHVAGYIARVDDQEFQRYRSILLHVFRSLTIGR